MVLIIQNLKEYKCPLNISGTAQELYQTIQNWIVALVF